VTGIRRARIGWHRGFSAFSVVRASWIRRPSKGIRRLRRSGFRSDMSESPADCGAQAGVTPWYSARHCGTGSLPENDWATTLPRSWPECTDKDRQTQEPAPEHIGCIRDNGPPPRPLQCRALQERNQVPLPGSADQDLGAATAADMWALGKVTA
jgi:hypothetical protein